MNIRQNFLNMSLILLTLFTSHLIIPASSSAAALSSGGSASAGKLPSVADVFGGMSEQEIAEQVQMGQKFLEDLQTHGSPQEIAEFQRLLEETLNSMSEEDFKDIQAIAQMVEPHLTPSPEFAPPVASSVSSSTAATTESTLSSTSDVDEFKKLISTIIQRIDDIFQKINSSKECAEEIDSKWKNKSTFANMKRQIHQLKNDRLAQKLSKADLKDEDKKLVTYLKKYLKDLTEQNNALVIEDDFGLPASFAEEKKHLKQTKAFIESCNEAIDILMPMLENFLQKWDPEALQLAKEAESTNKKATTQATDATKRQASTPAQPKQSRYGSEYGYNPSSAGYGSDYGGYYPEEYGNYPGGYSPYDQFGPEESGSSGNSANTGEKTPKAKTTETTNTTNQSSKNKTDVYDYAMNELEGHVKDDFNSQHEAAFIKFMQNDILKTYPMYSKISGPGGPLSSTFAAKESTAAASNIPTTTTDAGTEGAWIDSKPPFPITVGGETIQGFKAYTEGILSTLEKDFTPEFEPLHTYLDDLKNHIVKMNSDELKKISTSKELKAVEDRLKRYQKTIEDVLPDLENKFKLNTLPGTSNAPGNTTGPQQYPGILDKETVPQYRNAHNNFIKILQTKISDEAESLLNKISSIKRSAKRNATKKVEKKEPQAAQVVI